MKIGILSRDPSLYTTKRLVSAAIQRGHEVTVVDPVRCYMNITSSKPMVYYKDKKLNDFEAIIPRIGASITFYGSAVLRQFEMMGVFSVNESVAIGRSRDKLRLLQIMSRKGIGLPVTGFAHSTRKTQDLIRMVGEAPLVIKLLEGPEGKRVVLAETSQAAESVIDAFRGLDAHFLVQEFIKESGGAVIRCLVIGKKVVGSIMTIPRDGEFRSDLGRGSKVQAVKISAQERRTAIRATKALGLNIAGVDLLRSNHGPLVIDVTCSPGIEKIERAGSKDLATPMIEYIEKNVSPAAVEAIAAQA